MSERSEEGLLVTSMEVVAYFYLHQNEQIIFSAFFLLQSKTALAIFKHNRNAIPIPKFWSRFLGALSKFG